MEGQLTTHWVQHRGYNIVVDEPLLRIVVCDVRQRLFWAVSQIEFSKTDTLIRTQVVLKFKMRR